MAKPKTKKTNSFLTRTLAALAMLPVVIGALWAGYPYIDALILLVGSVLAWEWATMVSAKKASVYVSVYIVSLAVTLLINDNAIMWTMIVLSSLFVLFKSEKDKEDHKFLLILGVPYISLGISALGWIYQDIFRSYPHNFFMTLWFCLMVWAMDIGGYVVGSNVKGPKLAPKISPNKTWSGLIGGVAFAMIASVLYFHAVSFVEVVNLEPKTQVFFSVLGGLIAVISQIGDLIESAIKRRLGLKDSSDLIPGHGGVFDRIDGLIFAAPFVYWLFAYGLWLF